jgi:hypothetical protein
MENQIWATENEICQGSDLGNSLALLVVILSFLA